MGGAKGKKKDGKRDDEEEAKPKKPFLRRSSPSIMPSSSAPPATAQARVQVPKIKSKGEFWKNAKLDDPVGDFEQFAQSQRQQQSPSVAAPGQSSGWYSRLFGSSQKPLNIEPQVVHPVGYSGNNYGSSTGGMGGVAAPMMIGSGVGTRRAKRKRGGGLFNTVFRTKGPDQYHVYNRFNKNSWLGPGK